MFTSEPQEVVASMEPWQVLLQCLSRQNCDWRHYTARGLALAEHQNTVCLNKDLEYRFSTVLVNSTILRLIPEIKREGNYLHYFITGESLGAKTWCLGRLDRLKVFKFKFSTINLYSCVINLSTTHLQYTVHYEYACVGSVNVQGPGMLFPRCSRKYLELVWHKHEL